MSNTYLSNTIQWEIHAEENIRNFCSFLANREYFLAEVLLFNDGII